MNVYINELKVGGPYTASYSLVFEIPPNPSIAEINLSYIGIDKDGGYANAWIAHYDHDKQDGSKFPEFVDLEEYGKNVLDYHSMAADSRLMSVTFCLESNYDDTARANLKVTSFPGGNFTRYP